MNLSRLRDRRVMIAAGAGALALVAALGIGIGAMVRHAGHAPAPEPEELSESSVPASLQVELGSSDQGLDLTRPLRCFVGGQYVGTLPLQECAHRNGVQAGQLDVGLDTSGEVAAASSAANVLQPLPVEPSPPTAVSPPAPAPQPSPLETGPEAAAPTGDVGACWRYSGDWRKLGDDVSLDACVQTLFAGKCVRPGAADYGRWGDNTLRLVTGRVERQGSGGGFKTLVRQPANDCSIPHLQE
ncbi:MAG TPA: hypothetical protein VHX64_03740 [Caulobacteraceae bacterium]|nr:hypothetical protein [Caulobacteraceae bacterium]